MKYISVAFMVGFFIIITVCGLRDCDKPAIHSHIKQEPIPYVMADDIIFEVFMGDNYETSNN